MSNPDWTDPLDYDGADLLEHNEQLSRMGNMLLTALEACELHIANISGGRETEFRSRIKSVVKDGREVLR